MSEHNVSNTPERPVIPPIYLIWIAVAGLVVALGVWLTSGSLSVVGIGALVVSALSLVMWGLLAPEQVTDLLRGRAVAYGGTAVLVTVILVVAAVLVYIVVREQNWRVDYSGSNAFTLTDATHETVEIIAADPNTPSLRIVGFFTSDMADSQEQTEVLLQEFADAGGSKVSYTIYDPDREPGLAETYGASPGTLFVVPLNEDGTDNIEEATPVTVADQRVIVDAMITASALGDFRVYWLVVDNGIDIDNAEAGGGTIITTLLRDNLNWTVEPLTVAELTNPESGPQLGTAEDGEIIVIPGGGSPLPDNAVDALRDYIANGGDLVVLTGPNLEGDDSLATAPNMAALLQEYYGVTVNNDLVIDPEGSSSAVELDVFNFGADSITDSYTSNDTLRLNFPHSLTIADTLPEGVTVSVLATTGPNAYAKTGLNFSQEISQQDLEAADTDATGALPMGVAVTNSQTGSMAVIWGADTLAENQWRQLTGYFRNFDAAIQSMLYAIGYDDFLANLPTLSFDALPQDTPLIADNQQLGFVNFVSLILIPFGVLATGIMVWLANREHRPEADRPIEQI